MTVKPSSGNFFACIFKRNLAVRAAFKSYNNKNNAKTSFDKGLLVQERNRKKRWDTEHVSKDTFFKKYAHIHAKQTRERQRKIVTSNRNDLKPIPKKYPSKILSNNVYVNPLVENIYGKNSIIAALNNPRREYFTKLYYYGNAFDELPKEIKNKCSELNIKVTAVDKHRLNILTNSGVHNNLVLEAKKLQPSEITYLGECDENAHEFEIVTKDSQIFKYENENETISSNNLNVDKISFITDTTRSKKFPLGIYLDEINDPHNIGSIIRSAYFLGVDFILISRRNCSSLTPAVNKTSSGAIELMPIYYVDKPMKFFEESHSKGNWTFISSCLIDSIKKNKTNKDKILELEDLSGICNELPVILVVGNENKGIRTNLMTRSDFYVQIPFGRPEQNEEIDSLNVGVATALLINTLLR